MPNVMPISGAAAGTTGSPYVAQLTFAAVAVGNYILNNTNFPGLGPYIPGWALIAASTPANLSVQVSTDNGTTWESTGLTGGWVYTDSGTTVRLVVSTASVNITIFPMG